MRRVVQDAGDIGPIRIALLKGYRHLGARQQRQVQTISVPGIGPGLAHPQALFTRRPAIAVKQQADAVAPVAIDMTVDIVGFSACHSRRKCPGHHGFNDGDRAEAVTLRERNSMKGDLKAAVTPGAAVNAGDHHPLTEGIRHLLAAGHLQLLAGGQRRAAGFAVQLHLTVQVSLVANTGVKRPALRLRVTLVAVARRQVVVPPVIRLAAGGAVARRHIRAEVHILRRVAVVIAAGKDRLLHHVMMAFQRPHRLGAAVMLPGWRNRRQRQPLFDIALVIVKRHHVNTEPGVRRDAVPDPHLRQQA